VYTAMESWKEAAAAGSVSFLQSMRNSHFIHRNARGITQLPEL
jgi:hypothetical protein